ncbi:MAG: DUF1428 domain-containing protein [Alphaproteobacteria bacterium]|nr:DUF1428 domain-containing protein [Alphaproteobacteria bacterium]
MAYADGFVIVVQKKNVGAYKRVSKKAGKIWREHGCLDYKECVGDDLKARFGVSFLKLAKTKPNETVVFSWIVYRSRAHRDKVNAKVMADPRMAKMMNAPMPFDMKRFSYGGFKVIVDA